MARRPKHLQDASAHRLRCSTAEGMAKVMQKDGLLCSASAAPHTRHMLMHRNDGFCAKPCIMCMTTSNWSITNLLDRYDGPVEELKVARCSTARARLQHPRKDRALPWGATWHADALWRTYHCRTDHCPFATQERKSVAATVKQFCRLEASRLHPVIRGLTTWIRLCSLDTVPREHRQKSEAALLETTDCQVNYRRTPLAVAHRLHMQPYSHVQVVVMQSAS